MEIIPQVIRPDVSLSSEYFEGPFFGLNSTVVFGWVCVNLEVCHLVIKTTGVTGLEPPHLKLYVPGSVLRAWWMSFYVVSEAAEGN